MLKMKTSIIVLNMAAFAVNLSGVVWSSYLEETLDKALSSTQESLASTAEKSASQLSAELTGSAATILEQAIKSVGSEVDQLAAIIAQGTKGFTREEAQTFVRNYLEEYLSVMTRIESYGIDTVSGEYESLVRLNALKLVGTLDENSEKYYNQQIESLAQSKNITSAQLDALVSAQNELTDFTAKIQKQLNVSFTSDVIIKIKTLWNTILKTLGFGGK